ncbi:MAG: hydroxyacid dehydrogenase [Caldilinea sp. CFX5]|nr:hydroxyacid dehydrogenase [Caldilinea sp. CFX5]
MPTTTTPTGKPKVWTEVELHPSVVARLAEVAEVITGGTKATLSGVDIAIIGASKVNGAFLDHAGPQLKLVARHGIGYNDVDVPAATARGILATNTPDGPTEPTAEHTVALLLAAAKWIVKGDLYLRNNRPYTRGTLRGVEVRDLTLGIVGFGRIGKRVAEICGLGLRMRVVVFDPYLPVGSPAPAYVELVGDLDTLLTQADFLTLHTPLTPETHHLISTRELHLLKRGSYVINASRGPVLDEAALIAALQEGHLAGAGLDVFDPEPPHPDNPLLKMENVIVTPHSAGNTVQGSIRTGQMLVEQVLHVLRGERPPDLLNPEAWPGRMQR